MRVTLINFQMLNNGLLTAAVNLETAYAKCYLQKIGVKSSVYVQSNLLTLQDTVDDIAALAEDSLLFYISESNFRISQIITRRCLKLNIKVNWFTDCQDLLGYSYIVPVVGNNPNEIIALFETRASIPQHLDEFESPYLNNTLSSDKALIFGIRVATKNGQTHGINRIMEEIAQCNNSLTGGNVELVSPDLGNYREIEELLQGIKSLKIGLSLRVSINGIVESCIDRLYLSGVKEVQIILNYNEINEQILGKAILIGKKNYTGMNIKYRIVLMDSQMPIDNEKMVASFLSKQSKNSVVFEITKNDKAANFPYKVKMPNSFCADLDKFQISNESFTFPLQNGFFAFNTGIYTALKESNCTKHVDLIEKNPSVESLKSLSGFMGINSALITRQNISENVDYYISNPSLIKKENQKFSDSVAQADQQDFYFPHIYQVHSIEKISKIQFDDFSNTIEIMELRYKEAFQASPNKKAIYEITDEFDFEIFNANIKHFFETGSIKNDYELLGSLKDTCRFFTPNSCSLPKLNRFSIDAAQNIFPCGVCAATVGNIGDGYAGVVTKISKLFDIEKIKRNCVACPAEIYCPKCVLLPKFISIDSYCETRKKFPYISYYFFVLDYLRLLINSSVAFNGISVNRIKDSSYHVTHLFSGNKGSQNYGIIGGIRLFFVDDTPYLFEQSNFKILKISMEVAFVFEGFLKMASKEEIAERAKQYFNCSDQEAEFSIGETLRIMKEKNYIKNS